MNRWICDEALVTALIDGHHVDTSLDTMSFNKAMSNVYEAMVLPAMSLFRIHFLVFLIDIFFRSVAPFPLHFITCSESLAVGAHLGHVESYHYFLISVFFPTICVASSRLQSPKAPIALRRQWILLHHTGFLPNHRGQRSPGHRYDHPKAFIHKYSSIPWN